MALYRLYTENTNKEGIEEIVSQYYEGFTIIEAEGYWQKQKEKSLIIEIAVDVFVTELPVIKKVAKQIKRLNNQSAILIVLIEGKQLLI